MTIGCIWGLFQVNMSNQKKEQLYVECIMEPKKYYFKLPEGKDLREAHEYCIKHGFLYIIWNEGEKAEKLTPFQYNYPDESGLDIACVYTKEKLEDEGLGWLIDDDED